MNKVIRRIVLSLVCAGFALMVRPVGAQWGGAPRAPAKTIESFLYDFVNACFLRDWNTVRSMTTRTAFEEIKDDMDEVDEEDMRLIRRAVRGGYEGLQLKFSLESSGFLAVRGRLFRYYEYGVEVIATEERMEDHPLANESLGPFLVVETPNGWVVATDDE